MSLTSTTIFNAIYLLLILFIYNFSIIQSEYFLYWSGIAHNISYNGR